MTSLQEKFDELYSELKRERFVYLNWQEDAWKNVDDRETAEFLASIFGSLGYNVSYMNYGICHPKEGQLAQINIRL